MFAYCWQSGLIEFGDCVPQGAVKLIEGKRDEVKDKVTVRARHSRDSKDLLVPGVPEADDEFAAIRAVEHFKQFLTARRRKVVDA